MQTRLRDSRKGLRRFIEQIKNIALKGELNYGRTTPRQLAPYTHDLVIDFKGVRIMLTRDLGHHSGGWFKNPDYERCWHLSLSFRSSCGTFYLPHDNKLALEIVGIVFPNHASKLWIELPFSVEGKKLDVRHYRLFCDKNWLPIIPRKEVYTKEFTEKGWKSFSEIHGHKPCLDMEVNS